MPKPLLSGIINDLLAPIGLSIRKTPRKLLFTGNEVIEGKVGRYFVQMPAGNPLANTYLENPDCSRHLGQLAAVVKGKYPGMAALDIGANIGDTACVMRSAAEFPLICIEGDEVCFGYLQKNMRQFSEVTTHQLFLGEATTTMTATLQKSGWNTTIVPDQGASATSVNTTSLDDFLATEPQRGKIKLLKVDTEGFDCPILRGGRKFIEACRPAISLEYNRENMNALGERGLDTLEMLESIGYTSALFYDPIGRFLFPVALSDHCMIRDLHDYADGRIQGLHYLDITLFHLDDADLAQALTETERTVRAHS